MQTTCSKCPGPLIRSLWIENPYPLANHNLKQVETGFLSLGRGLDYTLPYLQTTNKMSAGRDLDRHRLISHGRARALYFTYRVTFQHCVDNQEKEADARAGGQLFYLLCGSAAPHLHHHVYTGATNSYPHMRCVQCASPSHMPPWRTYSQASVCPSHN